MNRKQVNPGLIVIDKPRGPTSHQVTAWVGEMLGMHVGHSGTLDPQVSGVLVIMLGHAVRLAPVLLRHEKEYICLMRLHGDVSRERVEAAARIFTGRIYQRPPKKSAVARNLRIRTVQSVEILDVSGRLILMRVTCDAGTYIRSLCHHIGLVLLVGAHMQELRRTRSGQFNESQAHSLHELRDVISTGDRLHLESMIIPVKSAVEDLPYLTVRDSAVDALCHGAALAGVGVVDMTEFRKGDQVAILTRRNELITIGEALVHSSSFQPGETGLVVAPRTVFISPRTYPGFWKKRRHPS
ncbi:MAG: RNA-guided pseudouridylation complex pseudouridine synthase subunit Cbf5 [Methanoregulaceae archaeon]|nr:RNA-guided pseudouridylation complex pseudouridine synthase subunit Cbf5 [Methanoregulaceae archaeon]